MSKTVITKGQKFGRLTVIKEVPNTVDKQQRRAVKCKCDCGNVKIIRLSSLTTGVIKSCGCLQKEIASTHKMSKHPLFTVHKNMIDRCYNPAHKSFKDYGGRGIKVCKLWYHDKQAFFNWAIAKGWQKGLQLDRRNNNKGYKPSNCHFATRSQNGNNRRDNYIVIIDGEKMTLTQACRKFHIVSRDTAADRIKKGWDHKEAVMTKGKAGQYRELSL